MSCLEINLSEVHGDRTPVKHDLEHKGEKPVRDKGGAWQKRT
jgi:hypothetical protein